MISSLPLSNVSPATSATLAFVMLGIIVVSLVAGPALVYFYWNKLRKAKVNPAAATPAQQP